MVGGGGLQTPPCSSAQINLTTFTPPLCRSTVYFRPRQIAASHFPNLSSFSKFGRPGLCASAARSRTAENESGGAAMEMDAFDFDDDDEEYEDSEYEDLEMEEEEEEDESPLADMRKRFRNKPRGFGEGKVYDTSIEDQLVREIEQARRAQLANINNLKNNPINPSSTNKQLQLPKAPELSPSCVRVRLFSLPKKKNIHRNLQPVFKQVPGIINFYPAVSGNKKTRDPICKGFAFIDFISKEDANRFIQKFSGQNITFGKIQKQIKCEMMNPPSPDSRSSDSTTGPHSTSKVTRLSVMEGEYSDVNFLLDNASTASSYTTESDESDELNTDLEMEELELFQENEEPVHMSKMDDGIVKAGGMELEIVSSPSKQAEKTRDKKKKQVVRRKVENAPKSNIPGSALRRLNVEDKAVLTGVFSKYGTNANSS